MFVTPDSSYRFELNYDCLKNPVVYTVVKPSFRQGEGYKTERQKVVNNVKEGGRLGQPVVLCTDWLLTGRDGEC